MNLSTAFCLFKLPEIKAILFLPLSISLLVASKIASLSFTLTLEQFLVNLDVLSNSRTGNPESLILLISLKSRLLSHIDNIIPSIERLTK